MPPSRFIRLTEEEDIRLRHVEQDPYIKPKVHLRDLVLRLAQRGYNMRSIAAYTDRSPQRASGATSTAGRSVALQALLIGRLRATLRS